MCSSDLCFETCGERGVMSRMGEEVYPVWHALREVGEFAGGEAVWLSSDGAPELDGIALRLGRKTRVLVGNFAEEPQTVRLRCGGLGALVGMQRLEGGETAVELGEELVDFTVAAHGLVRVDFEEPAPVEEGGEAAEG